MQLHDFEGMRYHLRETVFHETAAGVWSKRVVAEVGASKTALNDLAEVDDPDQFGSLEPDEEGNAARLLMLGQIIAICLWGRRRLHPRMMQPAAPLDCREKLLLIVEVSRSDRNAAGSHR